MAALAEKLKKFTAESELKSEVVYCLRLEPFVEFDLQKEQRNMSQTMARPCGSMLKKRREIKWDARCWDGCNQKDPHLVPYDLMEPSERRNCSKESEVVVDGPTAGTVCLPWMRIWTVSF